MHQDALGRSDGLSRHPLRHTSVAPAKQRKLSRVMRDGSEGD